MEDDLLAAWAAQDPEDRESSMRLEDPEIVRQINVCMQQLRTAAEIQASQPSAEACDQQFDGTQLPLLASMKFDGIMESFHVRWPKSFCDDITAMRSVLQNAGGRRPGRRPLKRQQWHQLLQPPAGSWRDFERQLAQLVEQLVLSVRAEHGRKIGVKSEEQGSADEAAHVPGAARAAKRARQRERRRLGKAAAVGDAAGAVGQVILSPPPDSGCGIAAPAMTVVDVSHEPVAAANGAGCAATSAPAPSPVATPRVVECGTAATPTIAGTNTPALGEVSNGSVAGNVQPLQVRNGLGLPDVTRKQLPFQDAAPTAQSHKKQLPSPLPATEPVKVVLADTSVRAFDEARAEGGFFQLAADGGAEVSARGIGRGRPMGEQPGPWHGPRGRSMGMDNNNGRGAGMGRGRVLAPPPGLRGLHRQEKIPHGLSQTWIPAPIPEEDDESVMTPQMWATTPLQDETWMHDMMLPESAVSSGGSDGNTPSYAIETPSCWASYASPPSQTPVGYWSGPPSPRDASITGQAAAAVSAAIVGAAQSIDRASPLASPGLDLRQWAWLPVATAQTCPHCGIRFALPNNADCPIVA